MTVKKNYTYLPSATGKQISRRFKVHDLICLSPQIPRDMVSEFCSPQDLGYVHSIPDALKLVPPHTLAKRVWLTKSQFSLLNIYFVLVDPRFLACV